MKINGSIVKIIGVGLIFIAAIAIAFVFTSKPSNTGSGRDDSRNTKSSTNGFTMTRSGAVSVLGIPRVGVSVEIPSSLFTLTENQTQQYNNPNSENYLWLACGFFYREATDGSTIWISFPGSGSCGTERSFSRVDETLFRGDVSTLCERMNESELYSSCQTASNPPEGFQGVSFYEFVPEMGTEVSGRVAYSWYFEAKDAASRKVLLTYEPKVTDLTLVPQDEFRTTVQEILKGENSAFGGSNQTLQQFGTMVQSIRLQ